MAISSAGAWREYNGTAINPSAMIARSITIQRIPFAAINAQRSPFCNAREERNARACATISSSSRPLALTSPESRSSVRSAWSAEDSRREKISSRNDMDGQKRINHAGKEAHTAGIVEPTSSNHKLELNSGNRSHALQLLYVFERIGSSGRT